MTDRPLRFVQVGVGGFGYHWCNDVWLPVRELGLAEPAALVDIDAEALRKAATLLALPDECLFTDAAKAIAATRPDFVVIVVPPALHESMVNVAVQHGCHILSEKPIADTMQACARIYHSVRRAGLKMAVTMSHRFDQDKQTLQRLIQSGEHGRLDYIVGRNTWACRAKSQWGAFRYEIEHALLVEGTVHHFDIMRSLAGSNARSVHCLSWNPAWSDFRSGAQVLLQLEMENGVKVSYEGAKANASTLNGWCEDYWRAECELGTLELDKRAVRIVNDLSGSRKETPVAMADQASWKNTWLAELYCHWLAGGDPPPNTLEDNIQCAAMLFAAIESVETGTIVNVQDFLGRHLDSAEIRTGT